MVFSRLASILGRGPTLLLVVLLAGCTTADTLSIAPPANFEPSKYAAVVIDANTGQMLYGVNATDRRYPASLTKMMTLYLLFEAMDQGRVTRETQIPVSPHAAAMPPTKLHFRPGETIDIDSAIRAMVTKSANDVAVAVGEYLGGTETRFAGLMNEKARQLGMLNTVFQNASGLPEPAQHTTAYDMARLGLALRQRFPQYYYYFSIESFAFRGKLIRGHNKVLDTVPGADGIKTGYIRASGFNIVTSVSRDGRKLLVVVMGGKTAKERNERVAELVARYMPEAKAM
ncbi:MAG: penicillin-binding protein [Rhizobiales bacterium 65-79]|nr:D-alanyl-D-alanine carboxypeptidase [Hyphomicrobiales bacterium]OJU05155.1 MAG: penicillin-binding protein [Rhizobiales bacterium 65-79]